MSVAEPARRQVVTAAAGVAGLAALAACGSSGSSDPQAAGTAGGAAAGGAAGGGAANGGGAVLAKLSSVPVGSAVVAKAASGAPVVVSQPAAGKVVAFSAVCTHQGCTVAPAGTRFECPCHGSAYDAATGAVLHGPAKRPLAKVDVRVQGDDVVAG